MYTFEIDFLCKFSAGVNVADYNSLFKFIRHEVKSFTKYPIVFIRSCHDTTVKPVIERLVESFLTSNGGELEVSEIQPYSHRFEIQNDLPSYRPSSAELQ